MERIVEDKWVALGTEVPLEFATNEWEVVAMFSRKLNAMAHEAGMQDVRNTIDRYRESVRDEKLNTPKHSGGMLFPGDMLYTYHHCLKANDIVYIVMSNVTINSTVRGTYGWKESIQKCISQTASGCVRGFYEYRNEKCGDHIACMRELTLEEITEIIKGDEE